MATLLTELLHDAIQRADDIVQSLEAIESQGSPEVDAYRDKMKARYSCEEADQRTPFRSRY